MSPLRTIEFSRGGRTLRRLSTVSALIFLVLFFSGWSEWTPAGTDAVSWAPAADDPQTRPGGSTPAETGGESRPPAEETKQPAAADPARPTEGDPAQPTGATDDLQPTASSSHRYVLASGWYDLFLVDIDDRRVEAVINIDETAQDIAVTGDGATAYVATDAGLVVVDLNTRKRVGLETWGALDSVELMAGDTILAAMVCPGEDPFMPARPHTVKLVELSSGRELAKLTLSSRAFDLFTSTDGQMLFGSNRVGRTISWTLLGRDPVPPFEHLPLSDGDPELQRMTRLSTLAVLPQADDRIVLVGVETPGDEKSIILWLATMPSSGSEEAPVVERINTKRQGSAQGAVASGDGRWLYVNCKDHLMVYDLIQRRDTAWVPLKHIHRWLALTPDERVAVLTCTEEEGVGYLTLVASHEGSWTVEGKIDLPGSVNMISSIPSPAEDSESRR